MKIPFNRPGLHGRELEYIQDAIKRGKLAGDGHYTSLSNALIVDYTGAQSALLTHSATAALEMAAILLDLGPEDEVIMPSYTFVSTANAVVLRGATPVFVDIRRDTLNIDPEKIEAAVTSKTKAIFVVHYAGVICDMKAIQAIADRHDLIVVEDAAQALLSEQDGKKAGSFGAMAAFSFHETKNIISGEGGALSISDPRFIERAEIIREKGTNRKQFFRGAVDKYTWVDLGSSYLPSELTASFLFAQLEIAKDLTKNRLAAWDRYHTILATYEADGVIERPTVLPQGQTHNAHMYQILLSTPELRENFIAGMKAQGVITPFHYVPLHSAPAGKRFGRSEGDMSVTDDISARLVRLPMFAGVDAEQDEIIEITCSVLDTL
ncbi:dTDP-4-amino-4,6-dideoxygalactose transaminase [Litorimonas sp. WD9-15]|uniref:dTDP-4-amino-4,6-dideoxygalactose transaminase n=1 Tax=Litorimonas sp. WD9-15 TaxID=3418716 RepID=UPI003D00EC02